MSNLKTTISVKADQFLKGMGQAKESVDKVESSTKKASKTIDDLGKTSKKTASSTNDLKTAQAAQALESMKQERNAKRANKALKEMEKNAKSVGSSISNALGNLSTGNIGGFISSIKDAGVSFKSLLPAATSGAGAITGLTASFSAMGTAVYAALGPVGLITAGIAAIGAVAYKGIKGAQEFDKALGDLSAISGMEGQQLEDIGNRAKKMGEDFGVSAREIMKSMGLIGSQAPELLKDADALSAVTKEAMVLSKASDMSVEDSGKAITGVMNMFGVAFTEAKEIINTMGQASMSGSQSIEYVTKAIEKSGTVCKMAGMDYHEAVAAIETLGPAYSSAEEGGTALKTVMLKLITQTNNEFNPAVVGLKTALDNLSKANLSAAEMQQMFGDSGIKAASVLIEQKDALAELTAEITGTNTAYDQAGKKTNELEKSWNQLSVACENLWEEIGHTEVMKALGVAVVGIIKGLTGLVKVISKVAEVVDVCFVAGFQVAKAKVNGFLAPLKLLYNTLKDYGWMFDLKKTFNSIFEGVLDVINKIRRAYNQFKELIGYTTPASKVKTEKTNEVKSEGKKQLTEMEKQQAAENRKKEEEAKKQAEREEEARRKETERQRKKEIEDAKKHIRDLQDEMEKELQRKQVYQKMGLDTNEIDTNIAKLEEKLNKEGKKIGETFSTNMTETLKKRLTQDINDIASKSGAPKLKLDVALNMSVDELTKLRDKIKKEFGKATPIPVIDQKDMEPKIAHMSRDEQKSVLDKADLEVADKFREKWAKMQEATELYKASIEDYSYAYVDKVNMMADHTNTIISLISDLKQLDKDGASGWKWIETISNGLAEICDQIVEVIQSFIALGVAKQTYAAIASDANNKEAMSASTATAANVGKAMSGAASSASSLPFPANIAAIMASVAAVLSVIGMIAGAVSKAKKNAAGGIISGSTHVGDNILARVNAGEMVLNKRQQSHLFNMLDKGTVATTSNAQPELSFRIKGEDLVGAIKNYNNKHR